MELLMEKNNTLPYRFLPATEERAFVPNDYKNHTFSNFIKETIQMHVLTGIKVTYIDSLSCINDTGILACGQRCEQVECVYIHTHCNGRQLNETTIIIAIHDTTTKTLRFFKGLWDIVQNDIMVWCELMPDMAKQEIEYLANIAL
jgi:hypothetical protein